VGEHLRAAHEGVGDAVGLPAPAIEVDSDGYYRRVLAAAKALVEAVKNPDRIFEVGMRSASCLEQHEIALRACREAGIRRTSNVLLARTLGMIPVGTMGHEHVQRYGADEPAFRAMLDGLRDIPIVGDVRGAGYFQAIELVKDRETQESFTHEESETLLRGFLSGELFRRGLICRADDRGDPVIQLSPPLIAGPEHFAEIESVLRPVLEEAWQKVESQG